MQINERDLFAIVGELYVKQLVLEAQLKELLQRTQDNEKEEIGEQE